MPVGYLNPAAVRAAADYLERVGSALVASFDAGAERAIAYDIGRLEAALAGYRAVKHADPVEAMRFDALAEPDDDAPATAIDAASKYDNVALDEGWPFRRTVHVDVEITDVFLPSLLDGLAVSRVKLQPFRDTLALVFTAPEVRP